MIFLKKTKFAYLIIFIIIFILLKSIFQSITLNTNNDNKITYNSSKINGCIIILVRNEDYLKVIEAITQLEKSFNSIYNYPYVLFNNNEYHLS